MNGIIELTEKEAGDILRRYALEAVLKHDQPNDIRITSMRIDSYSPRFLTVKFTDEPEKEGEEL